MRKRIECKSIHDKKKKQKKVIKKKRNGEERNIKNMLVNI